MQEPRQTAAASPLRTAREAQTPPVSREGLADRTGLSLRTIERIENGEVTPQRSTLRLIALALGVDVGTLAAEEAA